MGPVNPAIPSGSSIEVAPFQNQTLEPGLIGALNTSLRRELHRDGTFRLATQGDGEMLLHGVITAYQRKARSFQPRDVLSVRDFEVTLTARITATDKTSGRVLLERLVNGRTSIRLGDDLPGAERQALPLLAENLAKRTVTLLAEGGW